MSGQRSRSLRVAASLLAVPLLLALTPAAASAVPVTPPGGWPPPSPAPTPGAPSPGEHIDVAVTGASVANPGQPLTVIATMANTGDTALTGAALAPVSGRCFSGDVLLGPLYELVGDGDASFEPGEIRARICRGYAPLALGSYTESFQGSATGGSGPVVQIGSSNLDVVASPATPSPPAGGWPAPPPTPPAPSTSPGASFDVRAYGPASINGGQPVTVLGTIANTGTTNLYLLEFAATSGPCTDTTQTVQSQLFQIHGDGDGVTVLEPGEMFGATCSGYANASYSQPADLRGRVVPQTGGATLEDTDSLAIAFLPNPGAAMTATLDGPATIAPGAPLTLTAVIENTGSIPLTLTSVVPDVPCPGTVSGPVDNPGDNDGSFEPGEKVEVSCAFTPDGSVDPIQAGITASASIAPADGGGTLTRDADLTVDVLVDSRIEIVTVDPPKTGPAGQPVTATAELTNPGNTALTVQSIVTTPTQCPPSPRQVIAGDLDLLLEPGEVWRFECTVNAPSTSDPITATSTVHALDPAMTPVQDSFSFPFDPLTDGSGGTSVDLLPEQPVAGGATVGTNTDTTPGDPIGTEVTSPYGTTISIIETTVLTTEPTSAGFLGWQVDIHLDPDVPGSSAANPLPPENPLRVVFYIDQSIFGNGGQIYRDGVPIPMPGDCEAAGVADPEPCIESRALTAGGDLKLTVLAVHASSWNFVANDSASEPGVTITTPADGASYLLGQSVNAEFDCTGELLIGGCVGSVPDGAPLATGPAALGPHDFSVTASVPGGQATRTHSYSVGFGFAGFDSPVDNRPVVNEAKAGSAIPVKFRLSDATGASAYPLVGLDVLAGTPMSAQVACGAGDQVDVIEETITQNGPVLSYDASSGRYKFVWKTAKNWSTASGGGPCRRLTITLRDGTRRTADFRFK